MSRSLGRLGAASLAITLLAPSAAHADRWGSGDPTGDVQGTQFDPAPEPCGTETDFDASANSNQDITRLVVRHTRRSVVVTSRFRDLDRTLEQSLWVYARSSTGNYWMSVHRTHGVRGRWQVRSFVAPEPDLPDPEDGGCGFGLVVYDEPCRSRPTIDFASDVVSLAVPRRCLGFPRWVRVGVSAYAWMDPEEPDDPASVSFHDEWDGGTELSPWLPPYGPRVRATRGARVAARAGTARRTGRAHRIVVGASGVVGL
ncbi:hypothetical protein [Nocardioides sp. MH1]|uniref:hypothetical protein n=1 Tax=Nocardioides sp. MH1 TaxID=3242490 RepID=UPI0035224FE8